MENKHYDRKEKEDKPVLAICYDFDKTLSPDDMQAQGYIQSVGCEVDEFWKESNALAENNDMDQNLAWMFSMINKAHGQVDLTRDNLNDYGSKVELFPGVEDWFSRIREYGLEHGVKVEHYIISSGLKEMIEGTKVAGEFEKIYACSFYYDENNVAVWPAQVINFTNKTQYLFRIEKGVLDVNDQGVNEYFSPEEIRVPFRNMVYIGDSDTDVPCMKLVNKYGGHSIGVFNADTKDKSKVYQMMREDRIKYFTPADYTDGSELDVLVKAIIEKTAKAEVLEEKYYKCRKEYIKADQLSDENEREKTRMINALDNSRSFAKTHETIEKLSEYTSWTPEQIERLFSIAINNGQVRYILADADVKMFYGNLLNKVKVLSEDAKKVKEFLNKDQKTD